MKRVCSICGGTSFVEGPGGRSSISGLPPRCETCQSLERHRSIRSFFNNLESPALASISVLQFSNDRAVDPSWFGHYEVSIYGGDNSLISRRSTERTPHMTSSCATTCLNT